MIIVRLKGGLGNQMFQYAAARRLAFFHGATVKIDDSVLTKSGSPDTPREYALDCFRVAAVQTSAEERLMCETMAQKSRGKISRLFQNLGKLPSHRGVFYYRERGNSFDEQVLHLPDNICLEGFWQSERYFADVEDVIRSDFAFANPPAERNLELAAEISSCNSVSLHVRRGDYLTNPAAAAFHGTCDSTYYRRAIEEIKQKVDSPRLFVFSDDPAWSRNNLDCLGLPVSFVSHNSRGFEDLRLMSRCRHNIAANSSFSWWGAWLNTNPEKMVIVPSQWFKDPAMPTSDLIPEGWMRLP